MGSKETDRENMYRIRLKGVLHPSTAEWFGDITIIPEENGETLLIGSFIDQPALRGFLNQLWDLNITVLSVQKMEKENHTEERREE